jgi:hypothetical protein
MTGKVLTATVKEVRYAHVAPRHSRNRAKLVFPNLARCPLVLARVHTRCRDRLNLAAPASARLRARCAAPDPAPRHSR